MRRLFLNVFALLAFTSVLAIAEPKLEIVGGDAYDWGQVKPDDSPLKAKVVLKNAGDGVLEIREVKPSCGCTTAPLDKDKLQAGETATLSITYNVPSSSGPHQKSIRISSNDPQNPNKYFTIKATVYKPIEIGPTQYFSFNEMQVGQKSQAVVKIKNSSDKSITISNPESKPDDLNVNFKGKRTLKPGEEIEIMAWVTPKKKGYYNCSLRLKTSHPDMSDLTIPGYGNVVDSPIFNSGQ